MALEPITRQEKIIAGQDLTPITRMEKFLKEFGGSGGGGAQPDWNAAEGEPGHILNRPFYESTEVLFDQRVECGRKEFIYEKSVTIIDKNVKGEIPLAEGSSYVVEWDGTEYPCTCYAFQHADGLCLGNAHLYNNLLPDNGLPFFFFMLTQAYIITRFTISILEYPKAFHLMSLPVRL